jgi:glyoxylase-like metal-dependent hydrolase (beta-lactamase superfamily II)
MFVRDMCVPDHAFEGLNDL